jgi:hypothetical protein
MGRSYTSSTPCASMACSGYSIKQFWRQFNIKMESVISFLFYAFSTQRFAGKQPPCITRVTCRSRHVSRCNSFLQKPRKRNEKFYVLCYCPEFGRHAQSCQYVTHVPLLTFPSVLLSDGCNTLTSHFPCPSRHEVIIYTRGIQSVAILMLKL